MSSVKEELHRLVDVLSDQEPENPLNNARSLVDTDQEPLSAEDWAAIRRGLEDIQAGRVIRRDAVRPKFDL